MKNLLIAICFLLAIRSFAQYDLNGMATQLSCNCYQLTPDATSQFGSVWNTTMIDLNNPFDFTFQVYLGTNDGGADGMSFTLQPINTSVGGSGGGMGYFGITPSVGVVIDTYQNTTPDNDPSYDHISINSNGDVYHFTANELAAPVQASSTLTNIEDGVDHVLRVTWDPVTQVMEVYFDGVLRVTYTGDIINNIFGGNALVYWGFTAATGGASNEHRFCTELTPQFVLASGATSACPGIPVQFSDATTSFGALQSWAWDFGDGNSSTDQNPTNSYATNGNYNVNMTVTDNSGCTAATTLPIVISSPNVTATATPTTSCIGGAIQLKASVTATAGGGSCDYTFELWDDWGDGWNGGQIEVFLNGVSAGIYTVASGSGPDSYTIAVNDGDLITTV